MSDCRPTRRVRINLDFHFSWESSQAVVNPWLATHCRMLTYSKNDQTAGVGRWPCRLKWDIVLLLAPDWTKIEVLQALARHCTLPNGSPISRCREIWVEHHQCQIVPHSLPKQPQVHEDNFEIQPWSVSARMLQILTQWRLETIQRSFAQSILFLALN